MNFKKNTGGVTGNFLLGENIQDFGYISAETQSHAVYVMIRLATQHKAEIY